MRSEDKAQPFQLSDNELLAVSGGTSIQDDLGMEIKEGRFITSSLSNYSSGELPKFSIGDAVKIKWRINAHLEVLCNAEIVGISESKNGGLLFRKYTYSVKILSCPNSDLIGMIEPDVHENCLSY